MNEKMRRGNRRTDGEKDDDGAGGKDGDGRQTRDKQSVSDGEELVMKEGEGMIGMTQSKTLKLLEREEYPY